MEVNHTAQLNDEDGFLRVFYGIYSAVPEGCRSDFVGEVLFLIDESLEKELQRIE